MFGRLLVDDLRDIELCEVNTEPRCAVDTVDRDIGDSAVNLRVERVSEQTLWLALTLLRLLMNPLLTQGQCVLDALHYLVHLFLDG